MTKKSSASRALARRETVAGYAFLLPSLIFFLGFVIYPMIQCVITSLFDSTMNREDIFIGFGNYIQLFQDRDFLRALKNTVIIVIVSVPVTCIFSLWVSSVIYDLKGGVLFRLPLHFLSACRDRFRGSCGCVEVDVQQLLRNIQLCR